MVRTSKVAKGRAGIYLGKAEEFLRLSQGAAIREDWNAVGLGAVHAGISSIDALTTFYLGERSRDADHQAAAQLIRALPLEGAADRAEQFALLVREKNQIEYEAAWFGEDEAAEALARAERLVSWARANVGDPGNE